MKSINVFGLLLVLLFTSCGTTYVAPPPPPSYFTQEIREIVQSKNQKNIEKIQFYNSTEIVLVYKTSSKDVNVTGGEVNFRDGYYYYTITFPKNTPAIAKEFDEKRLLVFFEEGADRYLVYGVYDDGKYALYGRTKSDGFYVTFEGKMFLVKQGNDSLIYKKDSKIIKKSDERTIKGVLID